MSVETTNIEKLEFGTAGGDGSVVGVKENGMSAVVEMVVLEQKVRVRNWSERVSGGVSEKNNQKLKVLNSYHRHGTSCSEFVSQCLKRIRGNEPLNMGIYMKSPGVTVPYLPCRLRGSIIS